VTYAGSISHFVFPAAFIVAVFGIGVYLVFLQVTDDVDLARCALTTTTVLCGLLLVLFVEPPTKLWVGGDELSVDKRPAVLAVVMLMLFAVILWVPGLRASFELTTLDWTQYGMIVAAVAVWAVTLQYIWRQRLVGR
jgi:cation-transporting ATPase E